MCPSGVSVREWVVRVHGETCNLWCDTIWHDTVLWWGMLWYGSYKSHRSLRPLTNLPRTHATCVQSMSMAIQIHDYREGGTYHNMYAYMWLPFVYCKRGLGIYNNRYCILPNLSTVREQRRSDTIIRTGTRTYLLWVKQSRTTACAPPSCHMFLCYTLIVMFLLFVLCLWFLFKILCYCLVSLRVTSMADCQTQIMDLLAFAQGIELISEQSSQLRAKNIDKACGWNMSRNHITNNTDNTPTHISVCIYIYIYIYTDIHIYICIGRSGLFPSVGLAILEVRGEWRLEALILGPSASKQREHK